MKLTQSEINRSTTDIDGEKITIAVRPQSNGRMKVFLVGVDNGRIYQSCLVDGVKIKTVHDAVYECNRWADKTVQVCSKMISSSRNRDKR